MVSWCAGFYEGEFLKMSSFSGRLLTPIRVADQINWLRDQLFEQSYDDNIYIYIYICVWMDRI